MERRSEALVDIMRVPVDGDPSVAVVAVGDLADARVIRCDILIVGGGTGGVAAALARGESAGTIESSSGSANDTPNPRRIVRRGMCFRVTNIVGTPFVISILLLIRGTDIDRRKRRPCTIHLKRLALHNAHHDR